MVHTAPVAGCGLSTPRWSVPGHTGTPPSVVPIGMTETAGLLAGGDVVWVGPPLAARAPRLGSVLPVR